MSLRNRSRSLVFLSFLLLSFSTAYSQGIIIPRPCVDIRPCRPPRPPVVNLPISLPVKSIALDTKIKGQVATTRVEQVFENRTGYVLEGTYFFPIPEDASVEQFAIWENGKKLSGEVRSREEARRIYNEIVRTMKDPGLLEYAGKDLFQASIFPIQPHSDKKIELTYSQILKADSGTVAYRYPLGSGRAVWNSMTPGDAHPGSQQFGTVTGKIEITANEELRNIYSPSHAVDVNTSGSKGATVTFESRGDAGDFRLFYGLTKAEFGLSLITYREPGKDGYFMLMLSPDDDIANDRIVEKDVVFILDTSGSMQDDGKLEKARPALIFGINSLHEGDRFNVINFSGEEHLMETALLPASGSNKKKSREFIERLTPGGGTNINDALAAAIRQFDKARRPKMLVLLTDGLPTVGEQDIAKIIDNVKREAVEGLRLFPFGVGYDVNTRLLDKLGTENSGIAEYVEPKEDLEVKVSSFFSKVNSPVLSDVELDLGQVRVDKMYPRKISDIFRGSQTVLVGRYTNPGELRKAAVRLSGLFGGDRRTFRYEDLLFPLRSADNEFLPRLWASRRVGWLIEEIRSNGESKELRDEIVDLGTRYGIVTPYTSYLATDGSFRPRETVGNRFSIDGAAGAAISSELREDQGRDAVKRSVQQNKLQANVVVAPSATGDAGSIFLRESANNRFIGTKNFINDAGIWTDAEFDAAANLPERKVRFGSEEYFDLAFSGEGIGRYLSIGKNVIFVWKGTVYRIHE